MSGKMKMLSAIIFAIMVVCSLFNVTTLAAENADTIQSEIAGEIITSDGKTVVAVILQGKDDILTKNEIAAEYNGITKWNTKNGERVSTGDTFSVGSNNYAVAIYGDVDSDGFIDSSDALLIERVVVKMTGYSLNEVQRIAADVDSVDGSLNSTDSLRTKKFKVGLVTTTVDGNPTKKEDPKPEVPQNLKAIYGQKLSDVQLPTSDKGTYKFEDNANTSVGDVGNNTFSVIYVPNDLSKYKVVRIQVTIAVEKAFPNVEAPKGLTATVGQTLADVTLPTVTNGTWEWDNESESVGAEGNHTFSAIFTHSDTKNYKPVTVNVTVVVTASTVPTEKIASIVITETNNNTTNYCYSDVEVATITATTESGAPATISDAVLAVTTGNNNATAKIVNGKIVLNATQANNYDIQFTKKGVATDAKITTPNDSTTEISKITAAVKEDETINKITVKDSNGNEVTDTIELFAGKDDNCYSIVFSHDYGTGKRDVPYENKTKTENNNVVINANNCLTAYTKLYKENKSQTVDLNSGNLFDGINICTADIDTAASATINISAGTASKNITVKVNPLQVQTVKINNSESSIVNVGLSKSASGVAEVTLDIEVIKQDKTSKDIFSADFGTATDSTKLININATGQYVTALEKVFSIEYLNSNGGSAGSDLSIKQIKLTSKVTDFSQTVKPSKTTTAVAYDLIKDGITFNYKGYDDATKTLVDKTITVKFTNLDEFYTTTTNGSGENSEPNGSQPFSMEQPEILALTVKEQPTEITAEQVEKLEELYEQIELNIKVKTRGEESLEPISLADLKAAGATVEADKSVDGKVTIKVTYEGKSVEVTINVKADEATGKPAKSPAKRPATEKEIPVEEPKQDVTNTDKNNTQTEENKVTDGTNTQKPEDVKQDEKTEVPETPETPVTPVTPETPAEGSTSSEPQIPDVQVPAENTQVPNENVVE